MSSWMVETKKMFYLQKGLLIIGLYFVLNVVSMMVLDKPVNPDIEMNASQYLHYLNQIQGPYSGETERYFADEAAKISDARVALQKVTDDFYDGSLGEE